jgi:hypothetical protein
MITKLGQKSCLLFKVTGTTYFELTEASNNIRPIKTNRLICSPMPLNWLREFEI